MITRAKRVLPGMIITLLLSSPVMAANTDTSKAGSTKVEPKSSNGVRRLIAGNDANPSAANGATWKAAANAASGTKATSGRLPVLSRPRSREVSPALLQPNNGRIIRRASTVGSPGTIDRNLIDDGTLWRERGGLATWQQTGMASWYGGSRWQGQRTSSGSRYDQHELTAAHATLPLGTKVRVTSHSGARSVIVTINDRPGTRTRIIDLSREAAKELGILDAGVAMVTLQPM